MNKTNRNQTGLLFHFETLNQSILLTLICFHSFYHSLSFFVTYWPFFITRCEIQKMPPKVFLKILQNSLENTYARVSSGMRLANLLKKETPTQVLFCELLKIFKNNFLASDGFSKYESLYMIVVGYCCSENIWKISRSISASHCKFW